MLEDGASLPSLPTETWIQILTEHGLSYADFKRVSRVSKAMRAFIQSSALDVLLFRGGVPTATVPTGTKATLHPVLKHGSSFIEKRLRLFFIPHPSASDSRTWTIRDLACSNEFATSPPVTELRLWDIGRVGSYITIKRAGGLRVIDMLDRIAKRWRQEPSAKATTCGCGLASYYELYYHDAYDTGQEALLWCGWRSVKVAEEGVVVLRRRWE